MVEESGIATLSPSDAHWPRALDGLGDRAPYVLFVRGATSFLARPMQDLVTVTGSRAASGDGEHVAGELAGDLANRERVLVAGGAYGVEAAVRCWRRVGTRSRCSRVAWTDPTRAGIVTCWTGWVMWVRW